MQQVLLKYGDTELGSTSELAWQRSFLNQDREADVFGSLRDVVLNR